jgi:hypothetical protein
MTRARELARRAALWLAVVMWAFAASWLIGGFF